MSFFIDASEQEAFDLIVDYFRVRRMKILDSSSPSYIRAEFGSWTSISPDNARGEVEVEIKGKNGGSYANLSLRFLKEFVAALIIAVFGTLLLCILMWWRVMRDSARIDPADMGNFLFRVNLVTFGLSAILFAVTVGLVAYSTSVTRQRFVRELSAFVQSLAAKSD